MSREVTIIATFETGLIRDSDIIDAVKRGLMESFGMANTYTVRVVKEGDSCPAPDGPCTCTNGIGCVNVPLEDW